MLIVYAIPQSIIIGLDRKVAHLVVKIFDTNKNLLAHFDFTGTDFEKIDFNTTEKVLIIELITDNKKEQRKIYLK